MANPLGLLGRLTQPVERGKAGPNAGLLGIDPMTWFQIAGALGQGAQQNSFGAAMGGVGNVLMNRQLMRQQQEQQARDDAQRQEDRKLELDWRQRMFEYDRRQDELAQEWRASEAARDQRNTDRSFALREATTAPEGGKFEILTPEEAAALGLATNQTYQRDTTTERVTPIGGTREGQFSQDQSKIAGYANRMIAANREMEALMGQNGFDPTARLRPRNIGIPAGSQEARQYERAQRDFASAVLRRETGAQINASEMEDVLRRYFPALGDSAETVAAKAAARERVIQDYILESGGAYQSRYGDAQRQAPAAPASGRRARDAQGRLVIERKPGVWVYEDGSPYGG